MLPYILDIPKEFHSYTAIEADNVRALYQSSFDDDCSDLFIDHFQNLNNLTSLSELNGISKNNIGKDYFGFEKLNYQIPVIYKNKITLKAKIVKVTRSKPKPYTSAL